MKTPFRLADQILQLVDDTPGINDAEIAEALDTDISLIQATTSPLLNETLRSEPTKAPNGAPLRRYWPRGYVAEKQKTVEAATVLAPVQPPSAPQKSGQTHDSNVSCVDLAITYLDKHGSADIETLRRVMGLNKQQQPTHYLAHAVKLGRIIKEGRLWKRGSDKPVQKGRPRSEPTLDKAVQPPKARIPRASKPIAIPTPEPKTTATTCGENINFAIWDNGWLQIAGDANLMLSPEATARLRKLLMMGPAEIRLVSAA